MRMFHCLIARMPTIMNLKDPSVTLAGGLSCQLSSSKIAPPLNFSAVDRGLYRSGFPIELNYEFLRQLGLRSIICLTPDLLTPSKSTLGKFCDIEGIALHGINVGENREPFLEMDLAMVGQALEIARDKAHHPCLIVCKLGTVELLVPVQFRWKAVTC